MIGRCSLGAAFLLLWLAYRAAVGETLAERIAGVTDAPQYAQAHWGLLVADLATGEALLERDPDKLFVPASTTKLFSVATALDALGADFRFETPVYLRGSLDEAGTLAGDLLLVASGDLSLGGRTDAEGRIAFTNDDHTYAGFGDRAELTAPDPLAGLAELARQVGCSGVRRVRGDVVIDDRLFEPAASTGSGPSRLTPIMVNDNLIDLVITPAEAGKPAVVDWRPKTSRYVVDALVETAAAEAPTRVTVTSPAEGRLVVRGQIAAGRAPLLRIHEAPDPASLARGLLIEALRGAGVAVDASPLADNPRTALPAPGDYAGLRRVALLTSPPFAESARLVLKVSHNLHASTLPLLVAVRHGGRTLEEGLARQREFFLKAGVPVDAISFGGGAGGSPADFVTPRATVALLRYMATRPDFAAYRDALPVLGVDGTLARAVPPDSPARGKAQAKTGTYVVNNTMNGSLLLTSKALAGYLTTAGGRELAFAFFVNRVHLADLEGTQQVGRDMGRLCEILHEAGPRDAR